MQVTVMGTSDLHGYALGWDYYTAREVGYGLSRVSTAVERIRATREHTLLLDAGDTVQGTQLAYYYARVEPNAPHPMATAMNAMRYDAVTLGNHDFDYGTDMLASWIGQMDAPVLGANAITAGTNSPAYQPFVIRQVGPVRIGILGLTNPGAAIWSRTHVEGKLQFGDLVEAARAWVPRIDADVIIVVAHAGDSGKSSYGDVLPNENSAALVAEVPGVDAVLFGHAHQDVPQRIVTKNGRPVLLTSPGKWGERLSVMDFTLTERNGRWEVEKATSTTLDTTEEPQHPKIVELIGPWHDKVIEYVSRVVAHSVTEMSSVDSPFRVTPMLDFVHHVQMGLVQRELERPVLSIAAPFSRTARFRAGPVTIRDIASLYTYDNTLEAAMLTGAQLKDYLEHAARYFDGGVPDYNYDTVSGLEYEIDPRKPIGQRITGVPENGEFLVALNDYRRAGGGNYPHVTTAPLMYSGQVEIRQAMIEYALAAGVIDPAAFTRSTWRLVSRG
jgi:2',3'-cyclic-nucleotide 2'-phosphodiesterase/3'-nucleotidase